MRAFEKRKTKDLKTKRESVRRGRSGVGDNSGRVDSLKRPFRLNCDQSSYLEPLTPALNDHE